MPVVDYKCDTCGNVVERDNDNAPLCCGEQMRRIWTKPAISFMGSGFYVNDYKRES